MVGASVIAGHLWICPSLPFGRHVVIVIAESLAGKRIAITGGTGFVGTALVERLLRGAPDCELILLVRDGQAHQGGPRVQKELLKNDAFDRLRRAARRGRRQRVLPGR